MFNRKTQMPTIIAIVSPIEKFIRHNLLASTKVIIVLTSLALLSLVIRVVTRTLLIYLFLVM